MQHDIYTFEEFRNSKISRYPHYLVVGHPISHSLSPTMHNLALRHYGLEGRYIAVDIKPELISDFIAWMNRDEFLGCNITIPFKKQLFPAVDTLSAEAKAVGAINTIKRNREGTELSAFNTDIYGFRKPLEEFEEFLDYGRAILFGTGGASLAVQYSLADQGFEEIIVVSRSPERSSTIKSNSFTKVVDYSQWQEFADEACLIVNTTPLGMGEYSDRSVVSKHDAKFLDGTVCYDLIYNPMETPFLKIARESGAITLNGLDMLIHQGSRSFEIWTEHSFPFQQVKNELLKNI